MTKVFGSNILLSGRIVKTLISKEAYSLRYLGKVKIKGKEKVVEVYECFDGDAITMQQLKQESLTSFIQGLDHYFAKEFIEAAGVFKKVLTLNPADYSAQFYLERAAKYLVKGVPEDWDGVVKMEEK